MKQPVNDFVIARAGSVETFLVLSEEEYADGLAEALSTAWRPCDG
jgi:hypothetical protein